MSNFPLTSDRPLPYPLMLLVLRKVGRNQKGVLGINQKNFQNIYQWKIVDSSFPPGNPLHEKLNWHNIKLSYVTAQPATWRLKSANTTPSSSVVMTTRWFLLVPTLVELNVQCPVLGNVPRTMSTTMPLQCTVTSDGGRTVKTYVGSTNDFARRYYEHRTNANNPDYKTQVASSLIHFHSTFFSAVL